MQFFHIWCSIFCLIWLPTIGQILAEMVMLLVNQRSIFNFLVTVEQQKVKGSAGAKAWPLQNIK